MKDSYLERRLLRTLERLWTRGEGVLNRLTTSPFNPLYHLGTLSIFLLIVLTVTGAYLTLFYRPGADRAYASVVGISASWLGSLMRTTHRYAADALIVVIFVHALKMLLSDRFWGSRWLAWISGWGLVVLIWIIGVMGYWLVWDQRAQWLTEYGIELLKGPVALTFVTPEFVFWTFAFFVIVLFLHVFLGVLILLGVVVHELRLSRARYWAPRWLMVEAALALLLLALWRPAANAPPADLSRLLGTVSVDWWYLGFLPLTTKWGNALFWGLAILLLGVLVALPWLARSRTLGPAVVTDEKCTGCALCFQKCPYGAIEMRSLASVLLAGANRGLSPSAQSTLGTRADDSPFKTLAVVHPALCTGCGLCVGTCSTAGIELAGLPTARVREGLRRALASARSAGHGPVVIFTCQRHVALGTLSALASERAEEKEMGRARGLRGIRTSMSSGQWTEPPVSSHELPRVPFLLRAQWRSGNPHPRSSILACSLPCVGMVQAEWVRESLAEGAQAVVILSCPADDCAFREGPHWLAQRLGRRQSLLQQGVHWLEVAPGDQGAVMALLQKMERETGRREKSGKGKMDPVLHSSFSPFFPSLRSMAAGLAMLILTFGLALTAERPATATPPEHSEIRLVLSHPGQPKAVSASLPSEVQAKLPKGVSPVQLLGGERFPVRLRVQINEEPVVERVYHPGGLRREGTVYGLESWSLPPGSHQVRLWMMDDGKTWRVVFHGDVALEPGRVRTLLYDEELAAFVLR